MPDFIGTLVDVLNATFKRGGNVVIPSFAVGRTQELLYFFRQIKQDGLITEHPNFPVYIDSPLAIEATQVFKEHMYEYMDQDTVALLKQGINPLNFDGLKVALTADESKLINEDQTPKVIISASGMCDAGRIRHHLKHNLWRPGVHSAVRGLPGHWYAGTHSAGRRGFGEAFWRDHRREG